MSQKILIVDDEVDVLDMLSIHLKADDFKVLTAKTGTQALEVARLELPALIVLDIMLPEVSGLEVCRALKRDVLTSHIPVIMLTAKSQEVDRVVGLELGADDYVTKPFSPRELLLRVRSVLRRGTGPVPPKQELGALKLDRWRHEVYVDDEKIELTTTEFNLLATLMERRGRVLSRDQLLNDVWGYDNAIDTRTVDTHMRRLREKLGTMANYIETVRGVGYRMIDKV